MEFWRPAVDDAEGPVALTVSGRDKGHAQAGDDPEGDDAKGGTDTFGGDGDAHRVVHDGEAQDGGGNDGETDAAVKDEIDAIARDAQHGLADEVEDGASDRRANDGCVEEGVDRATKPVARGAGAGTFDELAHAAQVGEGIGDDSKDDDHEQSSASHPC